MPFPCAFSFALKLRIACWQYTLAGKGMSSERCSRLHTVVKLGGAGVGEGGFDSFPLVYPSLCFPSLPFLSSPHSTSIPVWLLGLLSTFTLGTGTCRVDVLSETLTLYKDLQFTKPCDTHSLIQLLQQPSCEEARYQSSFMVTSLQLRVWVL